jgi:type IV secretion system protein VirD4
MLSQLNHYQKVIIVSLAAVAVVFLWLYLSSAIFFNLVDLSEDNLKPWSIFQYVIAYGDNSLVLKKIYIAIAVPPVIIVILSLITFFKKESIFGNARFATTAEMKRANLFGGEGILLGKKGGKFIIAEGTEHVLVAAPSRSGKGVGIVVPNLLNWNGSAVVLDVKKENFRITSGFREKCGHKVYLFDPADPEGITHCYNPLDIISHNPLLRINDIQKIANFITPNPMDGDPMWASEARKLFLSAVLFLQDTKKDLTLGEVYRFINGNTAGDMSELLANNEAALDPSCIYNMINFISMGDKQRSGVKSTLTSALDLFDNPLIDQATSKSDFTFADLRKKKITLYVGVTPNNLSRLKPLLNLFFQQCIDYQTQSLPNKTTEPEKILLLMDEFTALGRMDIIKDGIAFFAGYHIRLMPVIQGPSQLADKYGEHGKRSMISNFKYRVIFAPNDPSDAEAISRELGIKTAKQRSRSGSIGDGKGRSVTTSETGRALLLPQEVKQLSHKKEVIIVEAMPPIMADKIVYHEDADFKDRFYNIFNLSINTGPLPVKIEGLCFDDILKKRKAAKDIETDGSGNDTPKLDDTPTAPSNSKYLNKKVAFFDGLDDVPKRITEKKSAKAISPFEGLQDLTGIGKTNKPSFIKKQKLSDDELDKLLNDFWETGS